MNRPRRSARTSNPAEDRAKAPVVFITGTDTGVGKTLLTGLLLEWLRSHAGVRAIAIKPFISGDLRDARILASLQRDEPNPEVLAPYRYELPLAPGVAAESEGKFVQLRTVVSFIERMRRRCGCLLVEGCGGLLSPLGRAFSALEVIDHVSAHVIVVARNQLGAINQVLLTVSTLNTARVNSLRVVLMNRESVEDRAALSNPSALKGRLKCGLSLVPYLGKNANETRVITAKAKFLQKTLAGLLPSDTVTALLEAAVVGATVKSQKRAP